MSAVTELFGTAEDTPSPKTHGKRDVTVVFWIFVVFYLLLGLGTVFLGRVTPPPRPDIGPPEMQAWFQSHALGIQIGFVMMLVVAGGAAVSNGLVAYHMMRMSSGKLLAYGYFGSMAVGSIPGFQLVVLCFLAGVMRPERDPEMTRLLYDLGVLSFNGSLGCFSAAYFCLAVAIFYDKNRIFPKFFAYVSIWQIVTEAIATQMFLFESGAFSWNGIIAFGSAVVIFATWLFFLIPILRIAGNRERLDTPPVN